MTVSSHPTRSPEFLSRLRDGELSAEERRLFEAHRGECAECRETVAAFARSLDAFRSAPEPPAPADLAARILRKIRAQSPSRRPFGVMFGIDIRWAGVFLAALLVAIIAPGLFSGRRETRAASAPQEPLTAYVVDYEPRGDARCAGEAEGAPGPGEGDTNALAAKAPEPKTRPLAEGTAESGKPADRLVGGRLDQPAPRPRHPPRLPRPRRPPRRARGTAQKLPSEEARNVAPMAAPKRSAALATPERGGGEAGAFAREEAQSGEVRIEVRPLDAEGAAPDVARAPAAARLAPLRGREFVLVVGADGLVRSVAPAEPENERRQLLKDKAADAASAPSAEADKKAESADSDADASSALRELRFQAPGKPRRVLVRIR